jgi:hypothetical protein
MNDLAFTLISGVGATMVADLWGCVRKPLLGVPAPDYGMVGRWFGHMARGRFRHEAIAKAAPVRGERLMGWSAHYLTGVGFAALPLAAWGTEWIQQPTLGRALLIGLGTVVAPFLVMQPGMGAGIAGSRTARPGATRLQSLLTHGVFGLGLYVSARLAHFLSW